MVELVRQAVHEKLDVPEANVLMVATHTHAGPSVYAGTENIADYYPTYVAAAVMAILQLLRLLLIFAGNRE